MPKRCSKPHWFRREGKDKCAKPSGLDWKPGSLKAEHQSGPEGGREGEGGSGWEGEGSSSTAQQQDTAPTTTTATASNSTDSQSNNTEQHRKRSISSVAGTVFIKLDTPFTEVISRSRMATVLVCLQESLPKPQSQPISYKPY